MISTTIKQLATEIATLRGESLALECSPEESPFPDIEDRVRILAPVALTNLILEAETVDPFDAIPLKASQSAEINAGVVSLKLPEDFLRLAYVKMSDWTRGVSKAVYPSQATFPFTSSKWDGIRGSPQRPVAVIMPGKDGSRELCLYSSAKEASLETFLYFPRPSIGTDGDIRIPSSLYPRLIISLKDLITPF